MMHGLGDPIASADDMLAKPLRTLKHGQNQVLGNRKERATKDVTMNRGNPTGGHQTREPGGRLIHIGGGNRRMVNDVNAGNADATSVIAHGSKSWLLTSRR